MAGLLKTQVQLGDSVTAANNFVLTSGANNGTMKLARGNDGATTQDIITVDSSGRVSIPTNVSQLRLNTFAAFGTTNTAIRQITTLTSQTGDSSAVTWVNSAANGTSLTINVTGVWAITYVDQFSTSAQVGLSLNSANLTTGVASIPVAERLAMQDTAGGNFIGCVSYTGYFTAGSIIRPHGNPSAGLGSSPSYGSLTITRVA